MKIIIVTIIAPSAEINSVGYLFITDCMITKTFPGHAVLLKSRRQFCPCCVMNWNALVINCHETPAPINKLIPEPKPHLLIKSSM
ncbi:Uncharacterised protein [uncultured archaeon]|nr:Uncharacterised protein [uncultured archaeon]